MTLSGRTERDGFQKGVEERNITIAKKLLASGTDPKFVAYITDLSLNKVHELQVTADHAVEDA